MVPQRESPAWRPRRLSFSFGSSSSAHFDDAGLWSHDAVWFSRYGTLVSTIEAFVNQTPLGYFADELADTLHAEVQDPLRDLVHAGRLRRWDVAGRFLYTSADSRQARDQLRTRKTAQSVPLLANASALQISPEELKTAILLFYSLLDEQQRRLFRSGVHEARPRRR